MVYAVKPNTYKTIISEYIDGVATITLNRPELKVVMSFLQLRNDLKGIILTGEGRDLCSDVDPSESKLLKGRKRPDLNQSLISAQHALDGGIVWKRIENMKSLLANFEVKKMLSVYNKIDNKANSSKL